MRGTAARLNHPDSNIVALHHFTTNDPKIAPLRVGRLAVVSLVAFQDGGTHGNKQSRRAEIIRQILPYISANSYENVDRYWVFSASSIWAMIDDLTASHREREDHSLEDAIIKVTDELDVRDAANDAIHGVEEFNKKWNGRMDELDLYAHQSS
jgi:hypothetical protein